MSTPPSNDTSGGWAERLVIGGERAAARGARMLGLWRALPPERRLAAGAGVGLFFTLFLNWYQETVIARGPTGLRSSTYTLTGWAAFSFVEAAMLVIAAGVLLLLFLRAEGRSFRVPGNDGGVITGAGALACLLLVWRIFDKQGTTGHGLYATTSGIEWGIFVALAVAGLLTYAGSRIRQAQQPGAAPAATARTEPRRARASEMDADAEDIWARQAPTVVRRARARPRSIADGTSADPTLADPTPAVADPTPAVADPTPVIADPDPTPRVTRRMPLHRSDAQNLDIAEPPTIRLDRPE